MYGLIGLRSGGPVLCSDIQIAPDIKRLTKKIYARIIKSEETYVMAKQRNFILMRVFLNGRAFDWLPPVQFRSKWWLL